jgi:hypothetical protein
MSVEPAPKVFLQNKLSRSRAKLQELGPLVDGKRTSQSGDGSPVDMNIDGTGREQDQLLSLFLAYDADHSLGNTDDISEASPSPF